MKIFYNLSLLWMKILPLEEVEAIEIFSISDIRDNFVSLHNIQVSASESVHTQLVSQFFEAISLTQEQADMINEKTKGQGKTEFRVKQRVGRLTAFNFYIILEKLQIEITHKKNFLITVHCHQREHQCNFSGGMIKNGQQ